MLNRKGAPKLNNRTDSEIRQLIGARIRRRRKILGWTLVDLAKRTDCSYQQVQKYESGRNEIGTVRLHTLSEALDVDVEYFFTDVQPLGRGDESDPAVNESEIMRAARAIATMSPRIRERFYRLASALAGEESVG